KAFSHCRVGNVSDFHHQVEHTVSKFTVDALHLRNHGSWAAAENCAAVNELVDAESLLRIKPPCKGAADLRFAEIIGLLDDHLLGLTKGPHQNAVHISHAGGHLGTGLVVGFRDTGRLAD